MEIRIRLIVGQNYQNCDVGVRPLFFLRWRDVWYFLLRCYGVARGCKQCPNVESSSTYVLLILLSWSTRHYYKLNLLFLPSINGLISWTRHYSKGHKHFLFHVYEYSKNARSEHFESSRARLTRQLRLGSKKKPIWRLTCQQNTCVEKLDPKWHF